MRTRCSARSAAASLRAIARSCSRASTSAASATASPATTCPGSYARPARLRVSSGCGSARSRSTTSTPRSSPRSARDADRQPPPARPAPVRRRRRAARDGAALHDGHLPAPARAARGRVQPHERRDRRLPDRGRRRLRADAGDGRARRADEGARLPVLAAAGDRHRAGRSAFRTRSRRSGARGCAALSHELCLATVAGEDRSRRRRPRRSARAAATATTTRRGSSTRRSVELVRPSAARA